MKNQPKKGKKAKEDKATRRARKEREAKENGHANGNGRGSPGESNSDNGDVENCDVALDADSDDELTRRITAEAKVIERPDEIKDDEWAVDVSEEAVKARAKELPDDLKRSLVVGDDDEDDGDGDGGAAGSSAYDQLGSWILDQAKEVGGVSEVKDVDVYIKAKELGIESKHRTLTVLAQTLFDESIVKQIPKRAGMLRKVPLGPRQGPRWPRSRSTPVLTLGHEHADDHL